MVLELDNGRYAIEDAGPPRRWTVRCHVSWRGERNIPYKDVWKPLFNVHVLKP